MCTEEIRWTDDIEREVESQMGLVSRLRKVVEENDGQVNATDALDRIRSRLGVLLWVLDPSLTTQSADKMAQKAVYRAMWLPDLSEDDPQWEVDDGC